MINLTKSVLLKFPDNMGHIDMQNLLSYRWSTILKFDKFSTYLFMNILEDRFIFIRTFELGNGIRQGWQYFFTSQQDAQDVSFVLPDSKQFSMHVFERQKLFRLTKIHIPFNWLPILLLIFQQLCTLLFSLWKLEKNYPCFGKSKWNNLVHCFDVKIDMSNVSSKSKWCRTTFLTPNS